MKIFISWSGDLSYRAALALRDWIPVVLPFARVWISSEDIRKGRRWGAELAAELDTTNCGIVCLVPTNIEESWLNFEAGALSKAVDQAQVHPFLLGMRPGDLEGPLAQFQATEFAPDDLKKLIGSINAIAGGEALEPERIERNFQMSWAGLAQHLTPIAAEASVERAAKASNVGPGIPVPTHDLSEEDIKTLKLVADAVGRMNAGYLATALTIHPQRAQHMLERLGSLNFVYARPNERSGTTWHLSATGRAELVNRNLL